MLGRVHVDLRDSHTRVRALVLAALLFRGGCGLVCAEDRVDYTTQIKPLLRERCFACHGALKQEAGLRVDTASAMFAGGDSGASVVAGNERSLIIERISATDIEQRMPPEFEGEQLSSEQVKLLRDWIAQGATAPEQETAEADPSNHWAFQPIRRPQVPATSSPLVPATSSPLAAKQADGWIKNPIDAFIAEQHQRHELTVQQPASRAILLRRLYLDLIGIPPSAQEIADVDAATTADWYPRTVEKLLNDPRHGERWARHWMDIWRYSDWWGLGNQLRNSQKHIWHWRDWIIESLNDDLAYDEMVRLMLAADELYPEDPQKLRATGYLARNYFLFNRPQWMEETVEHVSKGFLGLTLNCAKCHDHKYDPIEQADFYHMRAFFEPYYVRMDMLPGESDLSRDGLPRVFDSQLNEPTYRYIRGQETNPDKSREMLPGIPKFLALDDLLIQQVRLPAAAWQPARQPWVFENYLAAAVAQLESARGALTAARNQLATAEQAAQVASEAIVSETNATQAKPILEDHSIHDSFEIKPLPRDVILQPAETHPMTSPESAVILAKADVAVAEAAADVAEADHHRIVAVAAAMRSQWATADNQASYKIASLQKDERVRTVEAVRAERRLALASARLTVATAEQTLLRGPSDKKAAAEQALATDRTALDKATEHSQAEVTATDKFTELVGAQWTPTRFLNSGKDDPTIEFGQFSTGRRTALAKWITDKRNPLTARVAANHIWTRHMGQPLVSTVFDFGRNGTGPTHPELLDWLASELMDHDWSMKHLHRLIVNSATYRLNSTRAGANPSQQLDPDNRYWWRRPAVRLESQVVRDSILSLAGNLDSTMGGPSVPPAEQATSTRRSLYFFHSNNDRNLFLTMFDEALVKDCYRREQSIVPQQALALTNSGLVLESAALIAQRLSRMHAQEPRFIRSAFRELLGFEPNAAEVAVARRALTDWRELAEGSDTSARANFVWALLNHNDFVTLR